MTGQGMNGRPERGIERRIEDARKREKSRELEGEADRDRERSEATKARELQKDRNMPVILAPTDGSEASLRAGEHAVRLARETGSRLVVLYVVDEDAAFHAGIHHGHAVAELERAGREATARIALLAEQGGVECREMLASGKPYRAIVSLSEELATEYVVLGTHGGSAFERMVLGSVSAKVLHLANRPVLVVGGGDVGRPPQGAERPTTGMSA